MRRLKIIIFIAISVIIASCSKDEIRENEQAKVLLNELIGGQFDKNQTWEAAVNINVSIATNNPAHIMAFRKLGETTVVYDQSHLDASGTVTLTVPQGYGNDVILHAYSITSNKYETIRLRGTKEQNVNIDLTNSTLTPSIAQTRSYSPPPSLCGDDIIDNTGYTEMPINKVRKALEKIEETVSVENNDALYTNYELLSNGPFSVSMMYGCTGCMAPRILGYYYHSPGTYDDMKFVELTETHRYDYINNEAKIQYQLDNKPIWYDSNFDHHDGYAPPYSEVEARRNDTIYGIRHVLDRYGERVTNLRGLTYKIDVPKGYHLGFYLKLNNLSDGGQIAKMTKAGIPSTVIPRNMKQTNFSASSLNIDSRTRSIFFVQDGMSLMGMEDMDITCDHDCNDVVFGIDTELEIAKPTVVIPDIDIIVTERKDLPWTIAFEDVYRNPDFDFNDAVIRVVPDYEKETADVYVCAAGNEDRIELYYSSSKGEEKLCELHEKLGEESVANTTTSIAITQPKFACTVEWPKNYTMKKDASRFYCMVKRGTCDDCGDILSLNPEQGVAPEAILIPGEWKWPKEGIKITEAYNDFAGWAKDVTDRNYWDWHLKPQTDKCVSEE